MVFSIAIISVLFNIFALWYIRELLRRFNFFSTHMAEFHASIADYESHLKSVYELETFYGDSTIEGLMKHTGDFREDILTYQDMFSLEEDQGVENISDEEGENIDA